LTVIGAATLALTLGNGAAALAPGNPISPSDASVARGQVLYQQNCAECHGSAGRGDGPRAAGLNPPPVDLTVHVNVHPDQQLFDWISGGISGSAMPAFGGQLSVTDRWNLVNYLHTLALPQAAPSAPTPSATP
jgi:mono/diheme cytochrome c family protein